MLDRLAGEHGIEARVGCAMRWMFPTSQEMPAFPARPRTSRPLHRRAGEVRGDDARAPRALPASQQGIRRDHSRSSTRFPIRSRAGSRYRAIIRCHGHPPRRRTSTAVPLFVRFLRECSVPRSGRCPSRHQRSRRRLAPRSSRRDRAMRPSVPTVQQRLLHEAAHWSLVRIHVERRMLPHTLQRM